jgi:4-phosphopantoate--beta-alanine ligase
MIREHLIQNNRTGVVAIAGLIAHGRGEAFDYLLGEQTTEPAKKAIRAAAALLLMARYPVISVNGNVAALAAKPIAELAKITNAKVEVNLFYRSQQRETAIKKILQKAGIREVLGVSNAGQVKITEITSERRRVDSRGIFIADVVFVPLEDGDRTEALVKLGKKVIAIDLNPLSRTAQFASVTIVDNIIRAMPILISQVQKLRNRKKVYLQKIIDNYNNKSVLNETISLINKRLVYLASQRN